MMTGFKKQVCNQNNCLVDDKNNDKRLFIKIQ